MPVDDQIVRRPTLTEVAALAGVSLKTASRALNREPVRPVGARSPAGHPIRDCARSVGGLRVHP